MFKTSILDELYHVFEERNNSEAVNASWKECRAELDIIPEQSMDSITILIHRYAGECEKSGFNNGFSYGVQLMLELESIRKNISN